MSDNLLKQFINKNSERAEEYRNIIEEMMGDYDSYHYAEDTLLGILDYIEKNDTITDAQAQAIKNIREKPSENYEHY